MRTTKTADAVILQPATEADLGLGLGVYEGDELGAALTVHTTGKGVYVVPLTAKQLGLLVSVGNTILSLSAEQVAAVKALYAREAEGE